MEDHEKNIQAIFDMVKDDDKFSALDAEKFYRRCRRLSDFEKSKIDPVTFQKIEEKREIKIKMKTVNNYICTIL